MNRRKFIQTTAAAAAATAIGPPGREAQSALRLTLLDKSGTGGVNWPIGCFNRPWHEKTDWGLDTALDGIKTAGYKLVGLLRTGPDELLTGAEASKEYLEQLKARINSRGLTVNMAALRIRPNAPLEEQTKNIRKQIDNAVFVGARFGLTFGADSPANYENYYEVMRDAAPYAQKKDLKVVLKPHGGASGAAEEIVRCMEKVNHPNFKIWFDAGNIIFYTGKDPVEQLKPIVQHVTGFCAKDCDGQKGSVTLEFGKGKVDFRGVFTEMKKAGFNGPIMVECVAKSETAEAATANALKNREYLENLFKTI